MEQGEKRKLFIELGHEKKEDERKSRRKVVEQKYTRMKELERGMARLFIELQ